MNRPTKRWWIAERCSRARATLLVQESSRDEAETKLASGDYDSIDITYYDIGVARIIREDKPIDRKHVRV